MRNNTANAYFFSMILFFISRPSFAQFEGRLNSKLFEVLFILGPLVFILSTFMLLEWRRRKKMAQAEEASNISDIKRKR